MCHADGRLGRRHLAAGGGDASGSVPANIIRSRDPGILIRVGGVSHDSLRFASRAYAAALARLDERVLSHGVDSQDPVREGHLIRGAQDSRVNAGKMGCEYARRLQSEITRPRTPRTPPTSRTANNLARTTYCWRGGSPGVRAPRIAPGHLNR